MAFALIILVTSLGYASFQSTKRSAIDEFNRRQLVLAQQGATSNGLYMDGLTRHTRAIGDAQIIKVFKEAPSRIELQRRLKELRSLGVTDIRVLDRTGEVRFAATAPGAEGQNYSRRKYFRDARASDSPDTIFIESIDSGRGKDRSNIVAIASPIFLGNRFAGLVMLNLDLDVLIKKHVEPLRSTRGGGVFLIDSQRKILWAPERSMLGKDLLKFGRELPGLAQAVKRMAAGDTGLAEFTFYRFNKSEQKFSRRVKEEMFLAYAPVQINNTTWSLGIWASQNVALRPITGTVRTLLLLVLVILAIIIGASVYSIIRLARAGKVLEDKVESRTTELRESEGKFRRIAEILQDALIAPVPEIAGLSVAVGYEPAYQPERVGGDFYDAFMVNGEEAAILVGDVAGKGIEAAGLTETVRSSIRALAKINSSPAFILEKTSAAMIGRITSHEFATALLAIVNIRERVLRIANAGHPPPVIFNGTSKVVELKPGLPLGTIAGSYRETELRLSANSGVVLFTDGLLEARKDGQFFGVDGILAAVNDNRSKDVQQIVEQLIARATEFAGGKVVDDIAVITIRFP